MARTIVYGHGRIRRAVSGAWMADITVAGKRLRRCFKSRGLAEGWIDAQDPGKPCDLTPGDLRALARVKAILPEGVTIEQVASEWVERNGRQYAPIPFAGAVAEYVEVAGKKWRPDTARAYRSIFARAIKALPADVRDHRREVVQAWIESGGVYFHNQALRTLGTFYRWLVRRGDLTALPIAGLELGRTPSPARLILTVPDARALVEATAERSPAVVPYLALGLFAGLRPSETCRLRACDVGQEMVRLEAAVTKMDQARTVEVRPNLREILSEFPLPPVGVLDPTGHRLRQELGRVAKAVGVGLPHDVLRHSFASYAYEVSRDAAATAYEMGHVGTDIFFRHYRGLVAPGDGRKYFAISV